MAKYSTTVNYNITTKLDASGINQLQTQLRAVENEFNVLGSKQLITPQQVSSANAQLKKLQSSLNNAFDPSTGMLNVQKFFTELGSGKGATNLSKLANTFKTAGANGQVAFNNLLGSLGRLDNGLKTTSKSVDKIFNTLGNTVRWGLIASAFQEVMNSAHRAVKYIEDLDKSLTDIQMVGHSSAEDMRELALQANEAAKALGSTTVAYTDATKIFVQQGMSLEESKDFAEMSLKLSNVAGESAEDAAEQITALKNGFQMAGDTVESSLDKIVKTSHITASSVEELATAATRVAATANTLGVTDEQLYSQLSTIIQVTREAPEIVGNSLKTIYARFADLKLGETLEDGMDLGAFSGTLEKLGVEVMNSNGELREMGSIMEDLMTKWDTFDRATKQGAAVTLAGKFQYNRLMTLMENADAYRDTLNKLQTDSDVEGLLDTKNEEVYLESLEGKMNQIKATFEGMISSLFNQDDLNPFLDTLKNILEVFNDFIKAVGGGGPVLTAFGAILTRIFSNNIAQTINNLAMSRAQDQLRLSNAEAQRAIGQQLINNAVASGNNAGAVAIGSLVETGSQYFTKMKPEQIDQYNSHLENTVKLYNEVIIAEKNFNESLDATTIALRSTSEDFQNIKLTAENYQTILGQLSPTQMATIAEGAKELSVKGKEAIAAFNGLIADRNAKGFQQITSRINGTREAMVSYMQSAGYSEQETKKLEKAFEQLTTASKSRDLENFEQALEKIRQTAKLTSQEVEKLKNPILTGTTQGVNLQNQVDNARIAAEAQDKANKAFEKQMISQVNIQNITNAVAALGQLAFAWQSFQSLGSLWTNDDLDLSEKMLQTLMNLGFTLPMLIDGTKKFLAVTKIGDNIKKGFSGATEALNTYRSAQQRASVAQQKINVLQAQYGNTTKLTAVRQMEYTAATTAATTAQNALKTSILATISAMGPLLAIGGIVAVATAWNIYSDSIKKAKEEANNALEEIKSKNEGLANSKKSWDELYNSYKETGKVTEEFRSSAKDTAEALNVEGSAALIAANNYDTLANSIDKAYDAQLKQQASADKTVIDTYEDAFMGKELFNGSIRNDLIGNEGNIFVPKEIQAIRDNIWEKDENGNRIEKTYEEEIQATIAYKKAIDELVQSQQALGDNADKNLLKTFEEEQKRVQNIFNTYEELKGVSESLPDMAKSIASTNEFQNKIKDAGNNLEAIKKLFEDDKYISPYFETLETDAEKFGFILEYVNDEAQKLTVNLKLAQAAFEDSFSKRLTGIIDASGNQVNEDTAREATKSLINKIQNSGLDQQQQIDLLAGLDLNKSIRQINDDIDKVIETGDLKSIELKGNYNEQGILQKSTVDTSELQEILKEAKLEEETFETFNQLLQERNKANNEIIINNAKESVRSREVNAGYAKRQYQDAKEIYENSDANEELAKNVEKTAEAYQDAVLAANRAKKAEEAEANNSKDVAAKAIQAATAMDDLSENIDKYVASLDPANQGTLEYAEALSKLQQDTASILGMEMDPQIFNEQFITDNLALIQQAASGVDSALDELRVKASEQIIAQIHVEGVSPEEEAAIKDDLARISNDMIEWAKTAPVDFTADLDGEPAFQTLNELLKEGKITAEQMQQLMNSWGLEPEIQMIDGPPSRSKSSGTFYIGGDGNYGTPSIPISWSSEMETTVQVPQITNAKSLGGGTSLSRAGTSSSSPRSSKRSSGGGGKSSSPKSSSAKSSTPKTTTTKEKEEEKYEPKTKDPIEEEIDRYERVDTWLQAIENDFSEVADEQDRLSGWEQVDNMNKQIDLLEDQIVLQKEKLNIQKQEAKELRDMLASQYGARFDENGLLTNYAAIHRKLEQEVNDAIAKYNAATTEEEQDRLEKVVENAQDKLDKFKDKYSRYDTLVSNEMKETEKALEDLKDQIEDIRIEALKTQTEAVDNLKELQEKLIEFNAVFSGFDKGNPFRDMSTSAQKLAKYFDDGTSSARKFYDELIQRTTELMNRDGVTDTMKKWYQRQIEQMKKARASAGTDGLEAYGTGYLDMEMLNLQNILEQIKEYESTGTSSIFGENSAELYEVAREIFDSATDMIADFEDEIENLKDAILDAIDDIGDRLDERREAYDNITEELEHQREIVELLRGENNYEEINRILEAEQKNYKASITSMQSQLDYLKEFAASLTEGSDEWKKVQEMIVDTQRKLNDLVEESLKNLREQYENTVNNITEQWVNNALGTDLDWLEEQWEMINRNADYYLDDVNAAYNIQKLQGKYQDLLDNAGDLHLQQLITQQMQEQLTYLREKEKLSEYDVKYAEMQIELLQKRIALEEAQRNKTQLKLRRDSQGNYNYVYTADTEGTQASLNDYLEAQNNAYNLSKEQMRKAQEDSLAALKDAKQLIDEIWDDANLSLEEKQARTREVLDRLHEYLDGTSEQLATSETNIIQDFIGMVDLLTDENKDKLKETYNQVLQGNTDAFDAIDTRYDTSISKWLYDLDDFKGTSEDMYEQLTGAAETYADQVDQTSDIVRQDWADITDAINMAAEATNNLAASNAAFIEQLKNDAGVIKEYEEIMEMYASKIRDAENAMRAYQDQVNDLQSSLVAKERENSTLSTQVQDLESKVKYYEEQKINNTSNSNSGSGSKSSSSGSNDNKIRGYELGELTEGIAGNIWTFGSWGDNPVRIRRIKEKFGEERGQQIYDGVQTLFNKHPAYGYNYNPTKWASEGYSYYKKFDYTAFDTGGYTGEWSDGNKDTKNGKLAWLHSKELVLNETDTKHLLQAVEVMRGMVSSIKAGALSDLTNIFNGNNKQVGLNNEPTVYQDVTIEAEFPNANSVSEIQEALLGLADQSLQYASRYR